MPSPLYAVLLLLVGAAGGASLAITHYRARVRRVLAGLDELERRFIRQQTALEAQQQRLRDLAAEWGMTLK